MIPHFDFDAPQFTVALRIRRLIGESVAALDTRENSVVDSRRLSRLFKVFRPSARQIGDPGQGELLAKRGLGARPKVVFKRRRQLTPPPAPFLLQLKQFPEELSRPFNMLFRRDPGEPDAGDDSVDRRPRLFSGGVNIFKAVRLEGIAGRGANLRAWGEAAAFLRLLSSSPSVWKIMIGRSTPTVSSLSVASSALYCSLRPKRLDFALFRSESSPSLSFNLSLVNGANSATSSVTIAMRSFGLSLSTRALAAATLLSMKGSWLTL